MQLKFVHFFLVPATVLVFAFSSCSSYKKTKASTHPPIEIAIIHTNDVYEIGALEGGKSGGMARLSTLNNDIRAQYPYTYSVLAGDFLNPSVMGLAKIDGERVRGRQMVDMMNQVGIDWVVFGNHEFDLPYEDLQKRINESTFGWIAGNVRHMKDGRQEAFAKESDGQTEPLPRFTIWEVPTVNAVPIKIGVLAVCLDVNKPDFVYYEHVFESAKRDFDLLSKQTDFVIALTHLEAAEDRELARRLPELKLIMGGHDHSNMREKIGDVIMAKADANAKTAYVHRLTVDPKSRTVLINSTLRALDQSILPDPKIAAQVKVWETKAYASFESQGLPVNETVATLPEPLDGLESHLRHQPTNLGTALARSIYESVEGATCGIINSGSVRLDDYLQGTITFFDLIRTMPFGGDIWSVEMDGKLLAEVLDAGEKNVGSGGYLQVYHVKQQQDKWMIGNQMIQSDEVYRVAISGFLMSGREQNLEFLTEDNPAVRKIAKPSEDDPKKDVRLVLANYLKKVYK